MIQGKKIGERILGAFYDHRFCVTVNTVTQQSRLESLLLPQT